MEPTLEQRAIIDAAVGTKDNLLISALAGAAKTSTLLMIADALPNVQTLCLAFNKRIADEMTRRLPAWCEARTLNALGHRAWSDTIGRRCQVDAGKNYKLLKAEIDGLSKLDQSQAYKEMSETLDYISTANTAGYVPEGNGAKPLITEDQLFNEVLDPVPSDLQVGLIKRVLARSVKMAFDAQLDFDDQILMPTVYSALFPRFPLVLVDETQDLSELNHAMLKKIARGRLIGVGDRLQAIYGFRGAHEASMDLLRSQFSMTEMPLSVTFRCPQSVVREAWWRAPNMKWPEWAKEGTVSTRSNWDQKLPVDHSAIICRNNAPLFSLAIKFLKKGRNCQIVGNDIGKGLLKIMKKFGQFGMPSDAVHKAVESWLVEKEKKSRVPARFIDRADCMHLFADQGHNLGEAMAYAEHLFSQSGPVQFMTGHKAKGLEYEDVFFLDQYLINYQEEEQEKNLRYVIQTRAKNSLTYIDSTGMSLS